MILKKMAIPTLLNLKKFLNNIQKIQICRSKLNKIKLRYLKSKLSKERTVKEK